MIIILVVVVFIMMVMIMTVIMRSVNNYVYKVHKCSTIGDGVTVKLVSS